MSDASYWKSSFSGDRWMRLSQQDEAAHIATFQRALMQRVRTDSDAATMSAWLEALACAADRILAQLKVFDWIGLFEEILALPVLRDQPELGLKLLRAAALLRLQFGHYTHAYTLFSEMLGLATQVENPLREAEASVGVAIVELYRPQMGYTEVNLSELIGAYKVSLVSVELRMHLYTAICYHRYYWHDHSNRITGLGELALSHWGKLPTGGLQRLRNPIAHGRVAYTLSGLYRMVGNNAQARRSLEEVEAALKGSDYGLLHIAVMSERGSLALAEKHYAEALEYYERALGALEAFPTVQTPENVPYRRMVVCIQLGMTHTTQGRDLKAARLHLTEALRIADAEDNLLGRLHAYHGLSMTAHKLGNSDEALALAEIGCKLAEAMPGGEPRTDWLIRYDRLRLAITDGEDLDRVFQN